MTNAILARRSIRKYSGEPIGDDHVRAILEAGMSAPSGKNMKPWHFVVVSDRPTLDRLAEEHPRGGMLKEASLAIAVCGDPAISENYWDQDCTAATENILLAVSMLGLGGCWLGCHPLAERKSAVRSVLGIPENIEILSLLSIGHPAETKEARTQYDEARVHRNAW